MPPRKRRSKAKHIQTSAIVRRIHSDSQNDFHANGQAIAGCRDSRANVAPHPIHSLPLEIFSQIFIFTLHIDSPAAAELHETSRHSERHRQIFNPLVLCAVCSSWRSLAFATPQLWQRVYIHISLSLEKAQAEKRAANLIEWIDRSRSLPLTLHISCDNYLHRIVHQAPIVSVVNDYAIRWKSVYFRNRSTALQLRPSPMPPLTLFQSDKWPMLLTQIPDLSCTFHASIQDTFSWAELTHLHLHGDYMIPCQKVKFIFKKSPKLVQLSITVSESSFEPFDGSTILHNLVTLSLKMSYGSGYLLDQLSLPSLRDLFINQVSSEHIQPLLNFFTRSWCSLRKLEVYGRNLPPDDLLSILAHRSCNSLTSLKIFEPCDSVISPHKRALVDNDVLRRLTLHQDDSLCPHLKFLTFDCVIDCSLSALLQIVESRVSCLTDWQLSDVPIQYLYFSSIKRRHNFLKLDEVGKGSGMEYTRRRHHIDLCSQYFYSLLFQKQGLQRGQLSVNHGGFFFDQV